MIQEGYRKDTGGIYEGCKRKDIRGIQEGYTKDIGAICEGYRRDIGRI